MWHTIPGEHPSHFSAMLEALNSVPNPSATKQGGDLDTKHDSIIFFFKKKSLRRILPWNIKQYTMRQPDEHKVGFAHFGLQDAAGST